MEPEDNILKLLRELKGILTEHGLEGTIADRITEILYELLQERGAQVVDYVRNIEIDHQLTPLRLALERHEHGDSGEAVISLRHHLSKWRP